nr:hypothetical protein [Tanacetum cinerariifolium]
MGYLLKPTGIKQFWSTATLRSPELGPPAIQATIDETPYTITEDLVRSQLQLADNGGIDDLPIVEIYSGMDNLGYVTEGKLTFFKNKFLPQWRFLVYTILHCDSTKSGFEHGQSSDPNIASFSRTHEIDDDPFTNVEDEPLGGSFHMSPPSISVPADVPTSANVPTGSTSVSADVPTSVAPAGVSNKGKPPMVEEDITVKEKTFKQMKDDRLREQAAKRLHDEEQAQVDRQRAELPRRRQQEVLASAMYCTEADWINIMAQIEDNASLSKTLMGKDG